MEDATWKENVIPDSESRSGIMPNTVAAVTDSDSQTVTINVLGGFATPTQTIGSVTYDMLAQLKQLVPKASLTDLRAFILLHELGHLTMVLGADRHNQPLADAFNKKIAADCFK